MLQGQNIMMMGSADKIPEAPKEQAQFLEDLPEIEQGWAAVSLSCLSSELSTRQKN